MELILLALISNTNKHTTVIIIKTTNKIFLKMLIPALSDISTYLARIYNPIITPIAKIIHHYLSVAQ
jgi:hypothetical protein